MTPIKKAIAAFLTTLVTWATSVVVSEPTQVTAGEWVQLLGSVVVASFLVWLIPNEGTSP